MDNTDIEYFIMDTLIEKHNITEKSDDIIINNCIDNFIKNDFHNFFKKMYMKKYYQLK